MLLLLVMVRMLMDEAGSFAKLVSLGAQATAVCEKSSNFNFSDTSTAEQVLFFGACLERIKFIFICFGCFHYQCHA